MWIYCRIYNNGKCRMLLITIVDKYILFRYLNLINENDFSNCFIAITTNVASRYIECLLHSYNLSQCSFGAPQVLIICRSDFNGGMVRGFHILYIIRMPAKNTTDVQYFIKTLNKTMSSIKQSICQRWLHRVRKHIFGSFKTYFLNQFCNSFQ